MSPPPIRIRYQTYELGEFDLHVRSLRDRQQFSDDDGLARELGIGTADWAYFGVVWDAGHALARLMTDFDVGGRRVLEVGCGIGLASLVLHKRTADITATDHHPQGQAFLDYNCGLNGCPPLPFVRCGWSDEATELSRYDLIIGSDLLYERDHAASLTGFIDRHASPRVEVIIVDPGRGECARFARHMESAGYRSGSLLPALGVDPVGFRGRYLRFLR